MRRFLALAEYTVWLIPIVCIVVLFALSQSGPETYKIAAGLTLGAVLALMSEPLKQFALRVWLGPRLDVRLNLLAPPNDPVPRRRMFVRLRVENTKSRIAVGCRPYLVNVEREQAPPTFDDTFPLHWAYEQAVRSVDLPMNVPRYFDVALITEGQQGFEPAVADSEGQLIVGSLPHSSLWTQNGSVVLTTLVAAEAIRPVTAKLRIDWSGVWPPNVQYLEE